METLTRLQLLQQLEEKYMGKLVKHTTYVGTNSYARIENINCESDGGDDFIVIAQIGSKRVELSREKFEENTTVL